VSVRLGRLEGVEAVRISLNEGKAIIELKADNTVALDQVRTVVEQAGFTPEAARVRARVQVALEQGRPRLRVVGTTDAYDAAAAETKVIDALKKQAGDTVIVEGIIEAPKQGAAARLLVSSLEADDRPAR
jgi:hypothetical protein